MTRYPDAEILEVPSLLVPCNPITSQPFAAQVLSRVSMWPIPLTPLTDVVRTLNVPNVSSSSRDLALAALCMLRAYFLSPRFPRRFFRANTLRFLLSSGCFLLRLLPSFFRRVGYGTLHRPSPPQAPSANRPPWRNLRHQASFMYRTSVVGDVTVPGSYLHSAFVVHSGSSEDDVWIADSGASCHMTHDRTRTYNVRPPPPGSEIITIGDRRRIKLEYIGNMDVIFHGKSDQRITLINVAYVPALGFNLYSLHAVQRTHLIVSDASGTHIIGANLTFPRSSSGSYLRVTRLPAGTGGARRRQGDVRATNLLRELGHSILPPPQEIPPRRNMCATGLHN